MINLYSMLPSQTIQRQPNATNNAIYYHEDDEDDSSIFLREQRPTKKQRHGDGMNNSSPTLRRQSYIVKKKTLNTKFKKPKKSVRFNVDDNGGVGADRDGYGQNISIQEIQNLWYNKSDLVRFRKKALQSVVRYNQQQMNDRSIIPNNYNNSVVVSVDDDEYDANGRVPLPRGMEAFSKKRRRQKAATIQYVLMACQRGESSDYVANLSAKLGSWNREIALREGYVDYLTVYQPHLVPTVPPVSSKPPRVPVVPFQNDYNAQKKSQSSSTRRSTNTSSSSSYLRGRPSYITTGIAVDTSVSRASSPVPLSLKRGRQNFQNGTSPSFFSSSLHQPHQCPEQRQQLQQQQHWMKPLW